MPQDIGSFVPTAEGGPQAKKGIPTWVYIAGAGVGVVVLIMLISGGAGGGSSSGTTAAGTSINAALGSLQEEQLNQMGQLGAGFQNVSTMFGDTQNQIGQGFTDLGTQLSSGFSQTSDQLTTTQNAINQGFAANQSAMDQAFTDLGTQVSGVSNQVTSVSSAVQALDATLNQEMAQINTGIYNGQQLDQATQNSMLQQDQNIISLINQVQNNLGGTMGTTKGEILTLAYALGKGQSAQDYLTSQGDYTQSGQTHEG